MRDFMYECFGLRKVFFAICVMSAGLLLAGELGAAEYYVDAERGSDANAGQSPETAWQSVTRVNQEELKPGDRVLFRSGQVWRGRLVCRNGQPGQPIVYTSFGEGAKPLLLGSFSLLDRALWTRSAENDAIWVTPENGSQPDLFCDVGNIILRNQGDPSRHAAFKKWSVNDLTKDEDFYYNKETRQIYFRSEENPADRYEEMEAALRRNIIVCQESVVVDGLALSCGSAHGVSMPEAKDCMIRNCDISWIGGGSLYSDERTVRFGNGVEMWNSAANCVVEGCVFEEVYDVAMSNQGPEVCVVDNVIWRNNTTHRCEQGYEIWFTNSETEIRGILFEKNECYDCGFGWGHSQRPNKLGTPLLSYSMKAKVLNFKIHNNVFANSKDTLIWFLNNRVDEFDIDHNVWRHEGKDGKSGLETPLFFWDTEGANPVNVTFEEYRERTGNDKNSQFNPQ
ncbi:MAG: right-handed parallel beta-helix repeat-containing protein [Planctomycetia bacterium]|nr:right-handed parallel beta-helix repeat-containing protein [Planctomycetia bacterium]